MEELTRDLDIKMGVLLADIFAVISNMENNLVKREKKANKQWSYMGVYYYRFSAGAHERGD